MDFIIDLIINAVNFSEVVDNLPTNQPKEIEAFDESELNERVFETGWTPSAQEQAEIHQEATAATMKMLLEKQPANQPIEVPDLLRSVKIVLDERGTRPQSRLEAFEVLNLAKDKKVSADTQIFFENQLELARLKKEWEFYES